ncbi:MAG: DUF1192 domain-containing protein [Azospirillaceae bacterium]|nr:DUF1192 domain-containing protein [Azospirillaceae bacterium]
MDIDDVEPRTPKPALKELTVLSIDELNSYIAQLNAEIARAREAIAAKQGHRSAAESFFRK